MKRILLAVEYDGSAYAGWQRQLNALAVQQVLEEKLSLACGHPVSVTGSSRTDAGVHALDQRVHFDTSCAIPPDKFPFVLNNLLPPDIRVLSGMEVPPAFHARFLTSGKIYTYRILNARHGSAMMRNTHWHVPVPLDPVPVRQALKALPGVHDFAAFQAAGGTAKTTVRSLSRAELTLSELDRPCPDPSSPPSVWTLTVAGNAFLYNMVRIIAGTVVEIGLRRLSPDAFLRAFETKDRLALGMTAPAHGLELTRVCYPGEAFVSPASLRWHDPEEEE